MKSALNTTNAEDPTSDEQRQRRESSIYVAIGAGSPNIDGESQQQKGKD